MAVPGVFVNLLEKHEVLTDKKTKKAEEKSIKKNDYVAGGYQGSFQKFWTIITMSIIKFTVISLDVQHAMTGAGDNQADMEFCIILPRSKIKLSRCD